MEMFYLVCAILGGTVMVCQFMLTLFGMGGDHDVGGHDVGHDLGGHDAGGHHGDGDQTAAHDAHASWLVGVISFRTIVAALAFFGLAGLGARAADVPPIPALALSAAVGFVAMMLVAYVMRMLGRLHAEGTARIERVIGSSGTVYLSVPGQKSGVGKVTVKVQGRTMEYAAVTASETEIPTGAKVVAVGVVGPGTVEVAPALEPERVSHV